MQLKIRNIQPYLFRGACYDESGRYDLALEDYNTALLNKNDKNHLVFHNRAATYAKIKDFTNALKDISKAIELKPDESKYLNLRASIRLDKEVSQ